MFNREKWEEITSHLEKGEYEIALKKAEENLKNFPTDLIAYLLLLQAQHRVGDFKACENTYLASQKKLFMYNGVNQTPLVLEYCEAMLDLQGTIPTYIQQAWRSAQDCLDNVMRSNPPERSYVICIRAFEAALALNEPLFGGNEAELIKDYINSGLSWHPKSSVLLELKQKYNQQSETTPFTDNLLTRQAIGEVLLPLIRGLVNKNNGIY
jgi:tetratricopeptide (TPR) repeat protein